MPSWWGKSSSKAEKKTTKESFIDAIHRKLKIVSEEKSGNRSRGSRRRYNDTISEKGSLSRVPSRSPSPSTHVSRCQSFAERPHAHPLPLPGVHLSSCGLSESGINASTKLGSERNCEPSLFLPLPRPRCVPNRLDPTDHEGDLATASISSDSTIDSDDPSDSRLLSPLTSDYENGNRTAVTSPSSVKQKDKSPIISEKSSGEILKSANLLWNNQILSTSRTQRRLRTHVQNLQIPNVGAFCSAPDSSMSSPSRSPIRAFGSDQVLNAGFWTGKTHSDIALLGSGHCSSPGSGHNSGHNSVGGDLSGQPFWPHSRCSPECSPIPSPRMTSPGPSSRIHSGAVSPLHPRAGGPVTESTGSRPEDGKQKSHRLPLPPLTISKACPFSPTYSTATSPSVPRSPSRVENPISPGSRWKKGRLLGRGTFGHVYLGFNSESGEMCAMKEVTLFSDDAKSRESAQQLGQEIALLSRLRHPNIVRYYGSETVEDKLYIYLEYVSGGSIYKILQDYGQLGESAIRSYTKQILSGLQYLHAKNTVHRDIKGANILVDPNGRVKLADFGMAKHITGQSCPLSFKGSPYWMAPEVIKNSNGSNLAVDIWSLGCTVLEMATTKPPWHQYEGVAAMFKIGNSKELPETPDHLSDEGKDFVKKCLQRNPLHRPSAAQLLEHPFVKHAASLERPILTDEPSETLPALTNTTRAQIGESLNINLELVIDNYLTEIQGIGQGRYPACFDSEGAGYYQSMGLKNGSGPSDTYSQTTRNMPCPVSPISSPLLRSRSPQQRSGRMSPSPISSPHTASGSSTPLTGGSGGIPFHHSKLLASSFIHEGIGAVSRSQNNFHPGASNTYQVFREVIENASPGIQFGQPVLADHVSQQLLRDHLSLNPSVDLNPSLSTLGRGKGF